MAEPTVLATTLHCMTLDENKQMVNRVVLMIKINLEGRKLILASLALTGWLSG